MASYCWRPETGCPHRGTLDTCPFTSPKGAPCTGSALRELSPHRERTRSPDSLAVHEVMGADRSTLTAMSKRTGMTSNWGFVLECEGTHFLFLLGHRWSSLWTGFGKPQEMLTHTCLLLATGSETPTCGALSLAADNTAMTLVRWELGVFYPPHRARQADCAAENLGAALWEPTDMTWGKQTHQLCSHRGH